MIESGLVSLITQVLLAQDPERIILCQKILVRFKYILPLIKTRGDPVAD